MKIPTMAMLPDPFAWCAIPAGDVTLSRSTWESDDDYVPPSGQTVHVAAYEIAQFLITNAQFALFEHAQDGYADPRWWDYVVQARYWRRETPEPQPSLFAGDRLPRTNINWFEAVAYCRWLSEQTGETITLPTDAQWQWAAQGGDGRVYPWGDDAPTAYRANFGWQMGGPTPVDAYPDGASPFGVYDMVGNVWEWCLTGYTTAEEAAASHDSKRVVHGGGAFEDANFAYFRVDYRAKLPPDQRAYNVGFRVARLADEDTVR